MKPSGKKYGIFKSALTTGVFLAALAAMGPRGWAGDQPGASPSAAASASPSPRRFEIPIPINHDAKGVRFPIFDTRGRLQMYFMISKGFRVDADHLDMKNAYMQTYDEHQTPDATIFMTRSLLNLNTRIVTSDVPVIIRRSDFEITGQKMVFNTQTHKGEMTGHVHMVIYNRQPATAPAAAPSPTTNPSPIAATSPRPGASPH